MSRSPSHTPSPSTKPASNTETFASLRSTSSPFSQIFTCSLRGSGTKPWEPTILLSFHCEAVLRQPLVQRQRSFDYRQEFPRRLGLRTRGTEARGSPDGLVPVRRPQPVGRSRARGPRKHALVERNPQCLAQGTQRDLGLLQHVSRVDDRRCLASRVRYAFE